MRRTFLALAILVVGIFYANPGRSADKDNRDVCIKDDLYRALITYPGSAALAIDSLIRENNNNRGTLTAKNDVISNLRRSRILSNASNVIVTATHDHEKFIFGGNYRLQFLVSNTSQHDIIIDKDDVVIDMPHELRVIESQIETGKAPSISFNGPVTKLNDIEYFSIPHGTAYTITWEYARIEYFVSYLSHLIDKIFFRPDKYTFTANIKMSFRVNDSEIFDAPSSNLPPGNRPAIGADTNQTASASDSGKSSYRNIELSKTVNIAVPTELDKVFLALCAVIGACIASLVRMALRFISAYNRFRFLPIFQMQLQNRTYRASAQQIRFETYHHLLIALLFAPLAVATLSLTQGTHTGIVIKIHDSFGGMMSGFITQYLVMRR